MSLPSLVVPEGKKLLEDLVDCALPSGVSLQCLGEDVFVRGHGVPSFRHRLIERGLLEEASMGMDIEAFELVGEALAAVAEWRALPEEERKRIIVDSVSVGDP